MNILNFSKKELAWLSVSLVVIFSLIFINLQSSMRSSRDFQRKDDLGYILKIVDSFQSKYGTIPASLDGQIVACNPKQQADNSFVFEKCPWGSFSATGDRIPVDPQNDNGIRYYFLSTGKRFQIFASLESFKEDEYEKEIVKRKLSCGKRTCNMGRAPEKTPVNISLEDYEKKLQDLEKSKN